MTKCRILLFSNELDPHVDTMVLKLVEMGHEPLRLNSQDIPRDASLRFMLEPSGIEKSIHLFKGDRTIDFTEVKAVWWRRPDLYSIPKDLSEQETAFANQETDAFLWGLLQSSGAYTINDPYKARAADLKIEQLQRAKKFGFDVPKTLVTNDPYAVRSFYRDCQQAMIYKVMTDPYLAYAEVARRSADGLGFEHNPSEPLLSAGTTMITKTELAMIDQIVAVPGLFQELVPKKHEVRITVIGDQVFAAEIHSQEHEKTMLDWRDYSVDIPYKKATLPSGLSQRCLDFVHSYGLSYGALDVILTPEQKYVFVENNPSGQYQFVEDLVPELRMTDALASCLIAGSDV